MSLNFSSSLNTKLAVVPHLGDDSALPALPMDPASQALALAPAPQSLPPGVPAWALAPQSLPAWALAPQSLPPGVSGVFQPDVPGGVPQPRPVLATLP